MSAIKTVCPRVEVLLNTDIRAGRKDRSFYLFSSLSFSLSSSSSSLYRENGRTGRYPDRKHGPWTSPFLLSWEASESAEDLRFARLLQASSSSSFSLPPSFRISPFLLRIFIHLLPPFLLRASVSLCFLSRFSSSFVSVSPWVSCSSNYFCVLLSSTCAT